MFEDVPMEKLTINLPPVELGRIDILIESGTYPSRAEFIRSAIRKALDSHDDYIRTRIEQITSDQDADEDEESGIKQISMIGVFKLNRSTLEGALGEGKRLRIHSVGMLILDEDIDAEVIEKTLDSIKVYGVLKAPKDVRDVIRKISKRKLPSIFYGTVSYG